MSEINTITQEKFDQLTLAKLVIDQPKNITKACKNLEAYNHLTSIENKEIYELIHAERMILTNARIAIEKQAKSLRDPQTALNKKISEKEKMLINKFQKTEDQYKKLEFAWNEKEKQRIADEKKAEETLINTRMAALARYGTNLPLEDLKTMPESLFQNLIEDLSRERGTIVDEAPPINVPVFKSSTGPINPEPIIESILNNIRFTITSQFVDYQHPKVKRFVDFRNNVLSEITKLEQDLLNL